MKRVLSLFAMMLFCSTFAVSAVGEPRETLDFNFNWYFHLGNVEGAFLIDGLTSQDWTPVRLPHDWSADLPYTQESAASSTGFKSGGIGWYKKQFSLTKDDLSKAMWFEFDGVYNNAQIWINGHFATGRPNGYISFAVDLTPFAREGNNEITVKVDRTAYNDARWYTGSGIYRDVRLVKTNASHIAHWGVQILTPEVSQHRAKVSVSTKLSLAIADTENVFVDVSILNADRREVATSSSPVSSVKVGKVDTQLIVNTPSLWRVDTPHLYTANITLRAQNKILDSTSTVFGIRSIAFDADKGFLLNGEPTEFKGVNLHHDAGAVGVAVPKAIWRYRLEKLQSVGVNAIRLAHNPHSTDLIDLADEMGFLVIAEMFDDWLRPKDKSVVFLSDNAGEGESVNSYSRHFPQWAERDLTDLIRRDFNHPSIIMWSIGNEIEWTYPYYAASQQWDGNDEAYYGKNSPVYEPERVKKVFEKNKGDEEDTLVVTAHFLSNIVKRLDSSRPVTAGMVTPSVNFVSGYTDALDVVGFNYRAQEYDAAHSVYPDKPIYGSENWGTWPEWKAAKDRDFIPGIFIWTGFAYKGEAGPWPRKGLEISLFDYAGNKTPRGHQFESFWIDKPKVYLATIEAEASEYQLDSSGKWVYKERPHAIEKMQWLRAWEWYNVENNWNYAANQEVIVHVYANTEESELFLNGRSLGKQTLSDENNRILLWKVPFEAGELKVVGYNEGTAVTEYALRTHGELASIELTPTKENLNADNYDVSHVHVRLVDAKGNTVQNHEGAVKFSLTGPARLLAVDNGSENSVQDEKGNTIVPHNGRALAVIQSTDTTGIITMQVSTKGAKPATMTINATR